MAKLHTIKNDRFISHIDLTQVEFICLRLNTNESTDAAELHLSFKSGQRHLIIFDNDQEAEKSAQDICHACESAASSDSPKHEIKALRREYLRQDHVWRPYEEMNMDAAMPMQIREL